ncbi:Hpt domain-containing response regulator [Azohydromonas australica]|uniref:Hpt domain-containing response regulator n=1 Tax=Azohydromonas australica TaxID=364039 RepID=UPI00040F5E05|nr:response regulator [Azohydromonas australica]
MAEAPRRQPRLAGLRLLVVDDVLLNCELASQMLALEGAHCESAGDGLEALRMLRAAAGPDGFDGVFLDVQMPVMDGLEAVRRIRADPALAHLPVIAVSAGVLPQQRQATLDAGMDDFIAKPIQLNTLVSKLLHHLALRRGAPGAMPAAGPTAAQAAASPGDAAARSAPPAREALPPEAAPASGGSLPAVPGVNGERAAWRLLGNRVLFLSMLRALREDHAEAPARIRAELARGDVGDAIKRLHRMRGLAANLSAETVAAQALRLEDALRAGDVAVREPALQALAAALAEVLAALPAEVEQPYGEPGPVVAGSAPADAHTIGRLMRALSEGDMGAFGLYQALRPELAERHGRDAVAHLDDAMDRLRFAQVMEVLRGWYPAA